MSLLDIATSVLPYLALFALMYLVFDVSYWLVLALAVAGSGFLLRTYILFHDCAHGNFLPNRRANVWLGRVLGLIVYTPYLGWRHNHAVHHATAGDLDRRGVGDVPTMTLAEYRDAPRGRRIVYRLFRNPLVMFGIGPFYALVVQPRLTSKDARPRVRHSVQLTNVALALVVLALCLLLGWKEFLLIQAPMVLIAGGAGVWLFYVQHQFEDTYWKDTGDWSYEDAALRGSSYLKLPQPFRFFTGNIGLHHVHHLSAKIPNYNLQRAHDSNPIFHRVPTLTAWDGLKATRLKLWDEASGRLLTWPEVRRLDAKLPQPA
jgi:omega-6 fatty acid desaturase (delta-12 desaturase)